TLTMHWDGAAWNVVDSPSPNDGGTYLAVSMVTSNEVWAVGYTQVNTQTQTLTARYARMGQCGTATPAASGTPVATASAMATVTTISTVGTTATPIVTVTSAPSTATPTATPTECTIEFSDVPQGSTSYDYIRCLVCMGI